MPIIPRYQFFFFGLCYSCNNYENKDIDCGSYAQNISTWDKNSYENSRYQFEGNYFRKHRELFGRNYKRFGALDY